MDEPKHSQPANEPIDTAAKTQKLPRISADPEEERDRQAAFEAGQQRILAMIDANAPLTEILESLVLLIEAQTPGMLCSVLLLSADGNHIEHGAAPNLPEQYVKAVNGAP